MARTQKRQQRVSQWWETHGGGLLLDRARDILPRWLARLQPEAVLQLGQPVFWGLPPGNHPSWVLLNDGFSLPPGSYLQAYGRCDALPFASMRFDLVIVPFCLSRMADPQYTLAECWRVLRPEGHILIMDFNPGGSLNVLRRWHLWRRDRSWPWRRPFLSLGQLRGLLEEQDFSLREGRYFQYTLPGLKENAQWLELMGDRWWPAGANAYLLLAQRREAGLPPPELLWQSYLRRRRRRALASGVPATFARDKD